MPPHVNAGESSEKVRIFLFIVDRPSNGRYSEVRALVRKEQPAGHFPRIKRPLGERIKSFTGYFALLCVTPLPNRWHSYLQEIASGQCRR
jgi:hypothetical protein